MGRRGEDDALGHPQKENTDDWGTRGTQSREGSDHKVANGRKRTRRQKRLACKCLALTIAGASAGCVELEGVTCALSHIPEGRYGTIGRTLGVDWTAWPVESVSFNSFGAHTEGDGKTGYIETRERGFLVVSLQDSMRLEGDREQPVRWTKGFHYELEMKPDGTGSLYSWIEPIGRVPSPQSDQARAGKYTPARRTPDKTGVWECKENNLL